VLVGGLVRRASDKVRAGQSVEVRPLAPPPTRALPESGIDFTVLYTDSDLVVVDKPAGLVVHPARGHEGGTLVNGLLALGLFDSLEETEETSHDRPGIVHRLDKDTSGVLVVARTPLAREHLKAQFASHSIEREYLAIAVGAVHARTFDTPHGRHPTDRLRFTTRANPGKRAVTHVKVLEALDGATLLSCRLETGRTHQIRVHLADAGTPLLGDSVYGSPPRDARLRDAGETLGRQALHARLLGFLHPRTAVSLRFESAVPTDFAVALDALRKRPPCARVLPVL
jgi:23S rRNA pseudouridine1911/1915/1917 synthase